MEISKKPICFEKLFSRERRYQIPRFQRYYAWRKKNWEQLWFDIHDKLSANKKPHFMGVIITAGGVAKVGEDADYHNVIDGQQRLTTLSVFLCAMRDVAKEKKIAGDWCKNITDKFLIYPFSKGAERFKILLRDRNRTEYENLINGTAGGKGANEGILGAHAFFAGHISDHVGNGKGAVQKFKELESFVGTELVFATIALDKEENIYRIFKSLNSTGRPLSHGDLIRNHVFSSVFSQQQEEFDLRQWQRLENQFGEEEKFDEVEFTSFLRHSVQRKDGYVPLNAISEQFARKYGNPCKPEEVVGDLSSLTDDYLRFVRDDSPFPLSDVEAAIKMVRDLSVQKMVAPLLLRLLELHRAGAIKKDVLIASVNDVAGFIFRRYVCGKHSRGYGRLFGSLCATLREGENALGVIRNFLDQKGWPKDGEFKNAFVGAKIGEGNYDRAALEALVKNKQQGVESINLKECDIEHVMPQKLTDDWKRDLGSKWEEVYEKWLHTPGNLTLIKDSLNRGGMKNHPYKEKQKFFAQSKVSLNSYFKDIPAWTEEAIKTRGDVLAGLAAKIWPGPPPKSK